MNTDLLDFAFWSATCLSVVISSVVSLGPNDSGSNVLGSNDSAEPNANYGIGRKEEIRF